MTSIAAVLEAQKSVESTLMQRMKEFEVQLKSSASTSDGTNVAQLQGEFRSFKDVVWNILSLLRQQIGVIIKTLDQNEARYRSKNLLLCGVPEKPGENLISTTVTLLQKHLGIMDAKSSSIKLCYRLGTTAEGRSRPVVVRFADHALRTSVWRSKTKLKGTSLVLREFLTKSREAVFYAARTHFGVSNVWTSDGNIFIKAPDGKRLRVSCDEELSAVVNQFPAKASVSEGISAGAPSASTSRPPVQTRSKRNVKVVKQ